MRTFNLMSSVVFAPETEGTQATQLPETVPVVLTAEQTQALQAYKDAYKAEHGEDTTLSDAALYDLVTDPENQEEFGNESFSGWIDAMVEAETDDRSDEAPATDEEITERQSVANTLVAKIADDETFNRDINDIIVAGETVKRGPLVIMLDMAGFKGVEGMQDRDGRYTKEELDSFPDPDMDADKSNNPGRYKVKRGGRTVGVDWYKDDFFVRTRTGKAIADEIAELDQGLETPPQGRYSSWGRIKIDGQKRTLNSKLTAGAKAIKKAITLYRATQYLDGLPKVKWEFRTIEDKDGNVTFQATNAPFTIGPTVGYSGNCRNFTVGQVTGFDVAKAQQDGGTFDALLASAKRDTTGTQDNEGDAEGKNVPQISNAKQFDATLGQMAHYFRDLYEDDGKVKTFYAELNGNEHLQVSCAELVKFAQYIAPKLEAIERRKRAASATNGDQARKAS